MISILFDESVDKKFQLYFSKKHCDFKVSNLNKMGWLINSPVMSGLSPDEKDYVVLFLAKKAGFDIFITTDVNFKFNESIGIRTICIDSQNNAPSFKYLFKCEPKILSIISDNTSIDRKVSLYITFSVPTNLVNSNVSDRSKTKKSRLATNEEREDLVSDPENKMRLRNLKGKLSE